MSTNNDYATGSLLNYLYHQKYYKLISIDLSRQTNKSIPQQINLTGKLEEDDGATKKGILNIFLDSLTVTEYHNNGTSKNIKFTE